MRVDKTQVLIIDDDSGMRATLSDILEEEGYEVCSYGTGMQALRWLKKNPFDVVIVDIKLPDMDGMKLLEEVRLINPESAVIIITGHASTETAVEAMKEGAYAYVIKPFNMDELKAVIKKALREIRLSLENKRLIDDLQYANRELEKANLISKELNRRKSEFLSNVSHALRTPLTSIKSFTEILLKYENIDLSEQKKYLTIMDNEIDRLTRLIDQLLDLDEIEHDEAKLRFVPCDICGIVQNSVSEIGPLIKEKGIAVSVNLLPKSLIIDGDEDRLKEVLMNLIGNAIKFTPPNGKIAITAREKEDTVEVGIADTGTGIPQNELANIFKRFKRLDNLINKKVTGTGLGLYICKQIIEKHKGEIWAESQEGNGSKFIFALPKGKQK